MSEIDEVGSFTGDDLIWKSTGSDGAEVMVLKAEVVKSEDVDFGDDDANERLRLLIRQSIPKGDSGGLVPGKDILVGGI